MKKLFLTLALMGISALVSIVVFDYQRGGADLPENVIQTSVYSKILEEERDIIIHLPVPYDSLAKYPVLYALDGSSLDGPVANIIHVLSSAGYASPAIVVGIPNMTAENRRRNLIPPFMHVDNEDALSPIGEADTFLDFMESELIPFIEKNYPVTPTRLFAGNSRGGLLVLYSLVRKSGLFEARFCTSTPMWRQDDILISKVANFLNATDSLKTFLFLSAGENETPNIRSGLERMTKMLIQQATPGLVWHATYTPHADHQSNFKFSAAVGIRKWSEYRLP